MTHDKFPPRLPPGPPRRGRPKDEAAFALWLRTALHSVFDDAGNAPMSPQLAALLEASRPAPDDPSTH